MIKVKIKERRDKTNYYLDIAVTMVIVLYIFIGGI